MFTPLRMRSELNTTSEAGGEGSGSGGGGSGSITSRVRGRETDYAGGEDRRWRTVVLVQIHPFMMCAATATMIGGRFDLVVQRTTIATPGQLCAKVKEGPTNGPELELACDEDSDVLRSAIREKS